MSDISHGSFANVSTYSAAASPWPVAAIRPVHTSIAKRIVDIAGAIALLFFFLPLFVAIAFLLWIEDDGAILFRQRRIGVGNREFSCLKFRTMANDSDHMLHAHLAANPSAEAEWRQHHKLRRDPRVTRIGRFLRRSSLDELPQLINILRGDMSLVGPRPITAAEIHRYGERFHDYLRCRPGLTGLWQISRRDDVTYARRTELDSLYVGNWSVRRDIIILARTVSSVIRGTGAY
jgi:lipopolysaccharide/colanic/teichoic acid biosynthesis glycosyltransferase